MQQVLQQGCIVGAVTGVASTGVFLLSNSMQFNRLSGLVKLRLNSSIDNTATKRSIIAAIRGNATPLAASSSMPGIVMIQTARYGGASVLVSDLIRQTQEGILFQPGEYLSVYTLADDAGCTFSYSLIAHYIEL